MDRAERAQQQWQREMPDMDTGPMMILGRLLELTNRVSDALIEPVFRAHGLKRGEFDVLATLRRSGPPYALTPTALYTSTMISSGGMTARLDRLDAAALIRRMPNPQDRRGQLVGLTDKGRELIEAMLPTYVEAQKRAVAALDEAEQAAMSGLLARLIAGLPDTP